MFNEQVHKLEDELGAAEKSSPLLTTAECGSLFRYLEHGSKEHRMWLAEAILSWSLRKPKPEVRD